MQKDQASERDIMPRRDCVVLEVFWWRRCYGYASLKEGLTTRFYLTPCHGTTHPCELGAMVLAWVLSVLSREDKQDLERVKAVCGW